MERGEPIACLTVRPYRDGDAEAINGLHNRVFGERRPLEVWRWKYLLPLPSLDRAMVVVEAEGEIVGFMGAVKRPFLIGGRSVAAFQYVDICIHPEHRRGGATFARVEGALKDQIRERGGELIYGFPKAFVGKWGKRRLGWRDTVTLPILFRPLSWQPPLPRRLRGGAVERAVRPVSCCLYRAWHRLRAAAHRHPPGIVVERTGEIDAGFDRVWERVAPGFKAIGTRDANYLRWRYQLNPWGAFVLLRARRGGETAGFLALKLLDEEGCRRGAILELLASEEGARAALIGEAVGWGLRERADSIECGALRSSALYRSLVQAEFRERGRDVTFYYVHETLPRGIERGDFEDEGGWYLTWGDTDFLG